MKTLVITGLSGTIGSQLLSQLPSDFRIWSLYHSSKLRNRKLQRRELQVDLTDTKRVTCLLERIQPDYILHMAAITHIDRCESDKENGRNGIVWDTNVNATKYLADYARKTGAFFCLLSTECVFPGVKRRYREHDLRRSINWYGTTKLHAEKIVESLPQFAILRAVVAYHREVSGDTIFGKFLRSMRTQPPLSVITDKKFTPTYTGDIVQAILAILQGKHTGIFHIASPQLISPHTFAKEVARCYGMDPAVVTKGVSADVLFGKRRASKRLDYAALDCTRSCKILGITPTPFQTILMK